MNILSKTIAIIIFLSNTCYSMNISDSVTIKNKSLTLKDDEQPLISIEATNFQPEVKVVLENLILKTLKNQSGTALLIASGNEKNQKQVSVENIGQLLVGTEKNKFDKGFSIDINKLNSVKIDLDGSTDIYAKDAFYLPVKQIPAQHKPIDRKKLSFENLDLLKFTNHDDDFKYVISSSGDLKIYGNVSNYEGCFQMIGGSVYLKPSDHRFFPGLVHLVSGSMTFPEKLHLKERDGVEMPLHLLLDAEFNVNGIEVDSAANLRKFMLVVGHDSRVNVNGDLILGKNVELGINDGSLTIVDGSSNVSGRIEVTKGQKKQTNAKLILKKGNFDVEQDGLVHVKETSISERAKFRNSGTFRTEDLNIRDNSIYEECTGVNNSFVVGSVSKNLYLENGAVRFCNSVEDFKNFDILPESKLHIKNSNYSLEGINSLSGSELVIDNSDITLKRLDSDSVTRLDNKAILYVTEKFRDTVDSKIDLNHGSELIIIDDVLNGSITVDSNSVLRLGYNENQILRNTSNKTELELFGPVTINNGGGIQVGSSLNHEKFNKKNNGIFIGDDSILMIHVNDITKKSISARNYVVSKSATVVYINEIGNQTEFDKYVEEQNKMFGLFEE